MDEHKQIWGKNRFSYCVFMKTMDLLRKYQKEVAIVEMFV